MRRVKGASEEELVRRELVRRGKGASEEGERKGASEEGEGS